MSQLLTAFTTAWQKSFDYSGRSNRGDYWWFTLANTILALILNLLSVFSSVIYKLTVLYMVAQIVPSLPLTIRRLRDAGKHWGWIFIGFVPVVGFWLIWLLVQPSAISLPLG
ncbi:MAG: DUF805 domain-containing protein [Cyanobium sp.]